MERKGVQKLLKDRERSLIMERSASKRGYRCQRCRNHNLDVARKGHVDQCPYRACRCSQCVLVERRTDTHRLLKQKAIMNSVFERKQFGTSKDNGHKTEPLTLVSALGAEAQRPRDRKSGTDRQKNDKRTLRCAKCSNHDVYAPLKNHKQSCPYRHCRCSMCHLVDDYRNILKDQIKTRRMQSRQRAAFVSNENSNLMPSKAEPSSPAPNEATSSPIRKSVIVSASTSPKPTEHELLKPAPTSAFDTFMESKPSSVLLLGQLAALSALWQHHGPPAVGVPFPIMPTYNFYNALSHGLNLQLS